MQVFVNNLIKLDIDLAELFVSNINLENEQGTSTWDQYLKDLYSKKIRENVRIIHFLLYEYQYRHKTLEYFVFLVGSALPFRQDR